jgi:hypothetical protein
MTRRQSVDGCPNCAAQLHGPYCSVCGQHQVDLDRPLRELVGEGLSTFFAFDTRIGRTLWPLIRSPGFLTREFLDGRRARYVHPFKLYFAFSLIFFLVFSVSDYSIVHSNEPGIVTIMTGDEQVLDGDGEQRLEAGRDVSIAVDDDLTDRISEFFAPLDDLAVNDPDRFNRLFIDRLSKSLIVLVPIVALLLQMLYWKPRFVAHLVFSLHLHCFSFLVLVVGALVDDVVGVVSSDGGGTGNNIATLAIAVYLFLALRRVYGQGRFTTSVKLMMLLVGYALALVFTMLGTLVATVASV